MPERDQPPRDVKFTAPTVERVVKRAMETQPGAVDVLGVKIDRHREVAPRVPGAERFTTFSEDEFSLDLLQTIAKSVALDQPLLLEGEAAVGKSYTIEYLAHLCNREVYRMSLNGQTDTTDLIGKWVPRTETVRKKIESLLKNPDRCTNDGARRLVESKMAKGSPAKKEEIAPEHGEPLVGFSREDMETIATLEGIEVPEGDWVWQDGDIPKQMKNGAWSVLDEVNTCEPQILVRLNALLEKGGQLVLSEDGSKVVPRHKDFRLFATVNPPGGRYKGRIPLSAEWISRWNYQNMGELPKEIRAQRLMAADGVPTPEVKAGKVNFVQAQEVPTERTLADYYGVEWVRDLYTKYAEFAAKVREMLRKGELAKDQTQIFDFDQRDDWRFREYIRKFHESGNIKKTIRDAITYCFANKCKNITDRKKIVDLVSLINVAEPKSRVAGEQREKDKGVEGAAEEEATQKRLEAIKKELVGMDLPEGHKEILLGTETEAAEEEASDFLKEPFVALQEKITARFSEYSRSAPVIETPRIPELLTPEHVRALSEIFGRGNLELLPTFSGEQLNDEYIDTMYPESQTEEDRARGLVSSHPSWWNEKADSAFATSTEEDRPTWGQLYVNSMRVEARVFQGKLVYTESIQKPTYVDGKQGYGTKEGRDKTKDALAPILQEVFGAEHDHRFSLTWDQINTELVPKVKEKIVAKFKEHGLAEVKFEVVCTPAVINNLQSTLNHPENSQTDTYEWGSTPLLKEDGTDSGHRLVVGRSDLGGAGYVSFDHRGNSWNNRGFRLSVVFSE